MPKFKQFYNAYLRAKTLPDTTGAVPTLHPFFALPDLNLIMKWPNWQG
jgi:hypothetical protein